MRSNANGHVTLLTRECVNDP